jgi:hypothetical protein
MAEDRPLKKLRRHVPPPLKGTSNLGLCDPKRVLSAEDYRAQQDALSSLADARRRGPSTDELVN